LSVQFDEQRTHTAEIVVNLSHAGSPFGVCRRVRLSAGTVTPGRL
jgi:hypothetical protein